MTPNCPSCGYNLANDQVIERDGFAIDPRGLVVYNGRAVKGLIPTDVCIFHSIAKNQGRPINISALTERCCDEDTDVGRVYNAVCRIRHALNLQDIPDPIKTLTAYSNAQGGYYWLVDQAGA
jgi:DNA-binding response OmpR family regulator